MSKADLINKHQAGVLDKEMPELKEEDFSRAKPNRFAKRVFQ